MLSRYLSTIQGAEKRSHEGIENAVYIFLVEDWQRCQSNCFSLLSLTIDVWRMLEEITCLLSRWTAVLRTVQGPVAL